MKKATREWEQKYYKEKARSIKILQADTMTITKISSSTKPILVSKVDTTVSNKGNEVVRKAIQTSEGEKSDSIETDDELSIQFGNIPRDFSVNMKFTLPGTFKAKEGQS